MSPVAEASVITAASPLTKRDYKKTVQIAAFFPIAGNAVLPKHRICRREAAARPALAQRLVLEAKPEWRYGISHARSGLSYERRHRGGSGSLSVTAQCLTQSQASTRLCWDRVLRVTLFLPRCRRDTIARTL